MRDAPFLIAVEIKQRKQLDWISPRSASARAPDFLRMPPPIELRSVFYQLIAERVIL
jgi:hypothetical protein